MMDDKAEDKSNGQTGGGAPRSRAAGYSIKSP